LVKAVACELIAETKQPLSRQSLANVTARARKALSKPISRSTVWRILDTEAIKPWRYKYWSFPRDPHFAEKAGPILDLYAGLWHGQWCEAKGLRFSLLDDEPIVHLLRWHQGHNEDHLGEALQQVKEAGWSPHEQGRLWVVCDGASWMWKPVQALLPRARPVLDSAHWQASRHTVAKVQYAASERAVAWVEATLTRLPLGKVGWVLGGLRRRQPAAAEALTAMDHCWGALQDPRDRTHYGQWRRGGYPRGSGGMESSNKYMCHVRLKRSGAWWYQCNGNEMLALRCAKENGTFDRVFERHRQRLRKA
jgi:hypothetical protein